MPTEPTITLGVHMKVKQRKRATLHSSQKSDLYTCSKNKIFESLHCDDLGSFSHVVSEHFISKGMILDEAMHKKMKITNPVYLPAQKVASLGNEMILSGAAVQKSNAKLLNCNVATDSYYRCSSRKFDAVLLEAHECFPTVGITKG